MSRDIRSAARDSNETTLIVMVDSISYHIDLVNDPTQKLEGFLVRMGKDICQIRNNMSDEPDNRRRESLESVEGIKTYQRHMIRAEVTRRSKGIGRADVRHLLAFHQAAGDILDEDTMSRIEDAVKGATVTVLP